MLGSVLSLPRSNPNPIPSTITPNDNIGKRRAQKASVGSASTILLLRGTAQRRNAGYIKYAQANATTLPSTPPNPNSRSGVACTISQLAKPNDAQTIDQRNAQNVIRRASPSFPIPRPQ